MLYTREQLVAQIQADREKFLSQSVAVRQAWSTQLTYFSQHADGFFDDDDADNHSTPSNDPEMLHC